MAFAAPDNTPLSPSQPNYAPETPRLEAVLHAAQHALALQLRVALPAQILAITGEQTVDVLPLFQTRIFGQKVQDMPVLRGVPVAMPQGADWRISFPLAVGDTGLCVFCDRNLDAFLSSDGSVPQDPQDSRCHDLNDAVFFPGLVPTPKQTTDTGDDLVLQNGAATLRLRKDGTVSLKNALQEAVALMVRAVQAQADALGALVGAQIATTTGPASFSVDTLSALRGLQSTTQTLHDSLKTFQA